MIESDQPNFSKQIHIDSDLPTQRDFGCLQISCFLAFGAPFSGLDSFLLSDHLPLRRNVNT